MEDPKAVVVLDISSDEEGDCVDIIRGIRKLLDDDDKVVVVGEVCVNLKENMKKFSSDDDDCVVLDGDPDKPRVVENVCGDDDDDLVLVSEKGEVACRDFPHPRHHCAKYPFSSSRHDMHCDKCHCYVCESLAPCADWGTGVSSFDHCHASDKQAFWTSQRMALRNVKLPAPIPVPPDHHIATSMRSPPVPHRTAPLVPNLVHQNQGLRPETNSVTLNNDRPCMACSLRYGRWNHATPCMACIFSERSGDSHMGASQNIATSMRSPPVPDRTAPLVPNLVHQNQGLRPETNSVTLNNDRPCLACSLRHGRWNHATPCMACIFSKRSGEASQNK